MNLVSLMDFPIYVRSTFGTDHLLPPSGYVCLPKEFNVRSSRRHPQLPFLIMDTGLQWLEGLPPKDPTKLYVVDPRASTVKLRAADDTESSLNFKNGLVQAGYAFSEHFAIEGQYSSSFQSEPAVTIDQQFDVTPYVKQGLIGLNSLTNAEIADVRSVKVNAHATADISLDSVGIYGVYRTSGNLYAKIKGGPVSINVKSKPNANLTWAKDIAATASPTVTDYIKSFETGFNKSFYDGFNSSSGGDQSERQTKFSVGVGAGYKIVKNLSAELEYTKLGVDVTKTSLTVNYAF